MSTRIAKPTKVAIIGASGTYGRGILARAEEVGVEVVVVTRSPHKFTDVKPTTKVVVAELDEEEKLVAAFAGEYPFGAGGDDAVHARGPDGFKLELMHQPAVERHCRTLGLGD